MKNHFLPFLIVSFIFSAGCVSDNAYYPPPMTALDGQALEEFKLDSNAPLGEVEGSPLNPGAVGLAEYGLAQKVSMAGASIGAKAQHSAVVFPQSIDKIFWYGVFDMGGMAANQIPRTFWIEWYSPDGELFLRNKFKANIFFEGFMKTPLELRQPLDESLIGRWRLRVWHKDILVDDRYFEIIRTSS